MATKTPAAPWAAAPVQEPAAQAPAVQAEAPVPATTPAAPEAAPAVPPAATQQPSNPPAATPAQPPDPEPKPESTVAWDAGAVVTEAELLAKAAEEFVIVTVPKAFMLRLDNDVIHPIKAGVQKIRKSWADHWYSVANGVKKFEDEVAQQVKKL